jgi:hypothetical protein
MMSTGRRIRSHRREEMMTIKKDELGSVRLFIYKDSGRENKRREGVSQRGEGRR